MVQKSNYPSVRDVMWQTDLKTVPVYTNTYMVILCAVPLSVVTRSVTCL